MLSCLFLYSPSEQSTSWNWGYIFVWEYGLGLNPGPYAFQASALPLNHTPQPPTPILVFTNLLTSKAQLVVAHYVHIYFLIIMSYRYVRFRKVPKVTQRISMYPASVSPWFCYLTLLWYTCDSPRINIGALLLAKPVLYLDVLNFDLMSFFCLGIPSGIAHFT